MTPPEMRGQIFVETYDEVLKLWRFADGDKPAADRKYQFVVHITPRAHTVPTVTIFSTDDATFCDDFLSFLLKAGRQITPHSPWTVTFRC